MELSVTWSKTYVKGQESPLRSVEATSRTRGVSLGFMGAILEILETDEHKPRLDEANYTRS